MMKRYYICHKQRCAEKQFALRQACRENQLEFLFFLGSSYLSEQIGLRFLSYSSYIPHIFVVSFPPVLQS